MAIRETMRKKVGDAKSAPLKKQMNPVTLRTNPASSKPQTKWEGKK